MYTEVSVCFIYITIESTKDNCKYRDCRDKHTYLASDMNVNKRKLITLITLFTYRQFELKSAKRSFNMNNSYNSLDNEIISRKK